MLVACVICHRPGAVVESGASLCMSHLHDWMLSQEGKTARRLHGLHSKEPMEKRVVQAAALMKIFITRREEWKVVEAPDITLDEG